MTTANDSARVCKALREVVTEHGLTQRQFGELIGESQQTVNRMLADQEPKASMIAHIERSLRLPLGTVLMRAELVTRQNDVKTMLLSDPKLIPEFQQMAVESYAVWVRLSKAERSSSF